MWSIMKDWSQNVEKDCGNNNGRRIISIVVECAFTNNDFVH